MKKMLVFATLVSIIVSVNGVLSAAVGDSWDLRTDIAFAGNPNGQWSYGYFVHSDRNVAPDSTGFILFGNTDVNHEGALLTTWYGNPNEPGWPWPYIGQAPIEGQNFDVYYLEGEVGVHPGAPYMSVAATARWPAPEAGQVSVDVSFIGAAGGSKDYFVILNGTNVLLNQFAEGLVDGSYADTLIVLPGDTIDVAVGKGVSFGSNTVKLDATFTYVPEPLTVTLLGLGFLMYKRRRIQ